MLKQIRAALVAIAIFTALTGVAYPLAVTAVAQLAFHHRANGSLIERDGKVVGSELLGRSWDDPKYFWGRPSATGGKPYDAANSMGSNLGPTNAALFDEVKARADALRAADPDDATPIPIDLVTSSGSGLDPDISREAAEYQAHRVARARGLDETRVRLLVAAHVEGRTLGFLGERRVDVQELNRALDDLR